MKVLHVVPSLDRAWGGPVTVVEHLTTALSSHGVQSAVLTGVGGRLGNNPITISGVPTTVVTQSPFGRIWTGHSFGSRRWLNEHVQDFDVIHIHELWHHLHYYSAKAANLNGIPYVVTPHGELGTWDLKQKQFKKRIFMALSQRNSLNKSSAIHALTKSEEASIIGQDISSDIHVIPNGVSSINMSDSDTHNIEKIFRELRQGPKILFLGRLHIKKGLDLLFETLNLVLKSDSTATLIIAGPEEDGSGEKLLQRLKQSSIPNIAYKFTGAIPPAEARMALRLSDVYIQPSRSEGFSMSTLEAISEGTPSVITTECNFDEIGSSGAGIVVAPDSIELADAIIKIITNPESARTMQSNATKLAQKYTWDTVSNQIADLYKSVI
ncbi:glycosyltransferase [Dehalococcoides mccartyi]|nr:glycosyltransferase [Dehalococcoides mccartyi]